MITEDYVSFEVAKLLKEKGFDWNTDKQFNSDKIVGDYNITDRSRYPERYLDAPALQMAMKWLREVHHLHCNIGYDNVNWYWDVQTVCKPVTEETSPKILPAIATIGFTYNTYEEACEAAIKYCLENLI